MKRSGLVRLALPLFLACGFGVAGCGGPRDFERESPDDLSAESGLIADSGPLGPILLYASDAKGLFSRYTAELLRAEGFSSFRVRDISQLHAGLDFSAYNTIVVAPVPSLSAEQVTALEQVANSGRHVVLIRPPLDAAALAGLRSRGQTRENGYWRAVAGFDETLGLEEGAVQYHGPADLYDLDSAASLATIDGTDGAPALTRRATPRGGSVYAFTLDISGSIVLTRQGDPKLAGINTDGTGGAKEVLRPNDLFGHDPSVPGARNWLDHARAGIPQADLLMYLFGNVVATSGVEAGTPVPRTWYIPNGREVAAVLTGDDHDNNATIDRFSRIKANWPDGCNPATWSCPTHTSYLWPRTSAPNDAPGTTEDVAGYTAARFEVASHISIGGLSNYRACGPEASSLVAAYHDFLANFVRKWPSAGRPKTNRNHCIAWSSTYTGVAEVEASQEIEGDTNYYTWPREVFGGGAVYMTGSGLPLPFARSDGTLILSPGGRRVYQLHTHWTDETHSAAEIAAGLERMLANARTKGWYGIWTVMDHTDIGEGVEAQAVLDVLWNRLEDGQPRRYPVVTARAAVDWERLRNGSVWSSVRWSGATLLQDLQVGPASSYTAASVLWSMLPTQVGTKRLFTVTGPNGQTLPLLPRVVHGREVQLFPSDGAGTYRAAYR